MRLAHQTKISCRKDTNAPIWYYDYLMWLGVVRIEASIQGLVAVRLLEGPCASVNKFDGEFTPFLNEEEKQSERDGNEQHGEAKHTMSSVPAKTPLDDTVSACNAVTDHHAMVARGIDQQQRGAACMNCNGYQLMETPLIRQVAEQLQDYFAGRRTVFDLPLDEEGTPFQRRVWGALCDIPYGTCRTYGEIARAIGAPGAARAVGMACNRNPWMIVVPCHRVVGAEGRLTGYAYGLTCKKMLLDLERQRCAGIK